MTPHPPELVERVARELFVQALMALWDKRDERPRFEAAWDSTAPGERESAHPVDFAQARYALDLAERAAREVIDGMLCGTDEAIRRAVEGV